MPLKLIVLTDLHLVPPGETILGIDPADRLASALAHINRHHGDANRLIITGDLTHYGDAVSYKRLRESLSGCRLPVSLMLGNHDDRRVFRKIFPECAVDPNGYVQSAIDYDGFRLIFLDTLADKKDTNQISDHGSGQLCPARLDWLRKSLSEARNRKILIFLHHPPHAVGFSGMDRIRLREEAEFFALAKFHGNVHHIFAGHIHRTISGSVEGIPFSVFKSPVHQQPMTFESDDTSLSVLEPAAYGIVFVRGQSVLVHTEDFEMSGVEAALI